MYPHVKNQHIHFCRGVLRRPHFIISSLFFLLGFLHAHAAFGQQTSKIQDVINSIKATYHDEDQDYITDGKRTVWVKSYKKWEPNDLIILNKEAPSILTFLNAAAQHNRYDILEQLLPEYYRTHGGAKAFADDILRAGQS